MFKDYQFRCSSLGKIISKSGKLTETTKSYLEELFVSEMYGVRKNITSKYFEKGLYEEESGITLVNKCLYPNSICLKNKEEKSNEIIKGSADLIKDGIVYDIKNAWDLFTFSKAELTHEYYYQLVGYMMLWELKEARLFYCINNTPEHLLVSEEKKIFYSNNFLTMEDSEYLELCNEMRNKHNFDHFSLAERFKLWSFDAKDEDFEIVKKSVEVGRNYMNSLFSEHQERIASNNQLMNK